jgi:hypothetical protein
METSPNSVPKTAEEKERMLRGRNWREEKGRENGEERGKVSRRKRVC